MGQGLRCPSPQSVRRVRKKSATQPAWAVVSPQRSKAYAQLKRAFHRSPYAAEYPGSVLGQLDGSRVFAGQA